jgi:hypothetical protein
MAGVTLQQVIDMAHNRLPRDMGKAALDKARQTCPVQSGDLYRSLYVDIKTSGFVLGATVPYASDVEEGVEPVVVTGSYTSKTKRHKRKTKNGTTTIRGHTKTYKNQKPVEISGAADRSAQVWRTRGVASGREGTFFMQKALESSVEEVMEKFMASIGATKNRR